MSLYEFQFSPDLDIEDAPAPSKTLIIASTPRSGSHMLGHSMQQTGVMGVPFEYANGHNLPTWRTRLGTAGLADTLRQIMACRTTPNGVFAIKLHYAHLAGIGGLERALAMFPDPRIVLVHRAELLRQAISLAEARQTGIWIENMAGDGGTSRHDHGAIRDALEWLAVHNALWRADLAALGQPWLELEFGEVHRDTPGTLRRIADFADIALDPARLPEAPPTKAQSDPALRDAAVRRYADDWARIDARRHLPDRIVTRIKRVLGGSGPPRP